MNEEQLDIIHGRRNTSSPRLFFILLMAGWTAVIGISVTYIMSRIERNAEFAANILAGTAFEKDILYRRWNAENGGVYAPVVPGKTEPNPYLPLEGRDLTTAEGRKLTKINPAYMTRLVHDLGKNDSNVSVNSNIIGLRPLRKENGPDPWEMKALLTLNATRSLFAAITPVNGQPHLRYVRALMAEPACLACHTQYGYKVGDILGAISISVPMAPFYATARSSMNFIWLSHGALWAVGMLGIFLGMRMVNVALAEREKAAEGLRDFAKTLEERVAKRTCALKKARDKAEEANRAKNDFLANMSHEIRTPLNGVIGVADILLRTPLSQEQASMASAIKSSGDSLLLLLNDVLDLSKVEAGELMLASGPFNPQKLLADAVKAVLPAFREKGLKLVCAIDPALPRAVLGDSLRIRQVLLNLLNNALKFTPSGEVRFTARLSARNVEEALFHFSVSDTGIGIPPEQKQRIFNAFEQADSSATRKHGGSGLGLTICASILSLMGSSIHLESIPGKGSTFSFNLLLPVAPEETAEHEEPDGKLISPHSHGACSVLLVEDVPLNRLVARHLLQELGHVVTEVENGKQAFDLLKKRSFDLVFMDIQMPVMDGISATKAIREYESENGREHTVIVAMTANAVDGDKEQYLTGGMDDFIAKPLLLEELRSVMARVARRKEAA